SSYGPSALVGCLLRSHDHEIAHSTIPVDGKIRHGDVADRIAGVRAIDRIHNPTPDLPGMEVSTSRCVGRVRNRAAPNTGAPLCRQQLRAIDDLHNTIVADAIGEIDAVKRGTRCGDRIAAVPKERLGRPGRDGAVDLGYQSKVVGQHAARLLAVKRPIPKKLWVRGVAEIKDEDMVFITRLPPIGCVNTASTDDVRDPRVAFPPTLVSGDEIPDNRVA